MKTFLINEQKRKTIRGGKGLCRVFIVEDGTVKDITERISEMTNREKNFDGINLTIHYGSGTGIMRISEILKVNFGNEINIVDISIF